MVAELRSRLGFCRGPPARKRWPAPSFAHLGPLPGLPAMPFPMTLHPSALARSPGYDRSPHAQQATFGYPRSALHEWLLPRRTAGLLSPGASLLPLLLLA